MTDKENKELRLKQIRDIELPAAQLAEARAWQAYDRTPQGMMYFAPPEVDLPAPDVKRRDDQQKIIDKARKVDDLEAEADQLQKWLNQEQPKVTPLEGEELALALLLKTPSMTNEEIASECGVSRSTVYRWRRFQKARKAMNHETPHGSKDKDGIEAWEEEE